jgi:ATP-dependent Clp protease adaptor protein ClpS
MTAKEKIKKEPVEIAGRNTKNERFLILHNDDYHSFDYVIESLIEICEHDHEQAVQCTLLTHYKGKCAIKKGSFDYLSPMKKALNARQLEATID